MATHTPTLPCGCVIDSTDGAWAMACEKHRDALDQWLRVAKGMFWLQVLQEAKRT